MSKIIKKKYYGDSTNTPIAETIEETILDNSDERIFELEKQLHEQYAVNNNSNAGILISLISALFVAFSGYGYVLYQYSLCACCKTTILYLSALAASMVMSLLYCICIHLGAGQRMEQFITFAIRVKHYGLTKSQDKEDLEYEQRINRYEEIYPEDYHPFNKGMNNFVQGIYGLLSKAFIIALYAIVFSLCVIAKEDIVYCPIFLCYVLLLHLLLIKYKFDKYIKYKEREKEMKILEYKESTKKDDNSLKFELHFKPSWVLIVAIVVVLLCTIASIVYPYLELFKS